MVFRNLKQRQYSFKKLYYRTLCREVCPLSTKISISNFLFFREDKNCKFTSEVQATNCSKIADKLLGQDLTEVPPLVLPLGT